MCGKPRISKLVHIRGFRRIHLLEIEEAAINSSFKSRGEYLSFRAAAQEAIWLWHKFSFPGFFQNTGAYSSHRWKVCNETGTKRYVRKLYKTNKHKISYCVQSHACGNHKCAILSNIRNNCWCTSKSVRQFLIWTYQKSFEPSSTTLTRLPTAHKFAVMEIIHIVSFWQTSNLIGRYAKLKFTSWTRSDNIFLGYISCL